MDEGRRGLEVVYNLDRILDAATHLTGQESASQILECLDAVGVEKAFIFAPMLNVSAHEVTSDNMQDIRVHNDYCADVCSAAPDRCSASAPSAPCPPSPTETSKRLWT